MSEAETEHMRRLETIVAELPEAERVDIEAWDDHPALRVRTSYTLVAPKSLARIVLAQDAASPNS